jgi:hypothetical protein
MLYRLDAPLAVWRVSHTVAESVVFRTARFA